MGLSRMLRRNRALRTPTRQRQPVEPPALLGMSTATLAFLFLVLTGGASNREDSVPLDHLPVLLRGLVIRAKRVHKNKALPVTDVLVVNQHIRLR